MTPDFFDVQVAIYDRLRNEQAFQGIGVYDYVPDDAVYPYIVIDSFTAARDGMMDNSSDLTIEQVIQAVSSDAGPEKGFKQVRQLGSCIYALFHNAALIVGGRYLQTFVSRVQISRIDPTIRLASLTVNILRF